MFSAVKPPACPGCNLEFCTKGNLLRTLGNMSVSDVAPGSYVKVYADGVWWQGLALQLLDRGAKVQRQPLEGENEKRRGRDTCQFPRGHSTQSYGY